MRARAFTVAAACLLGIAAARCGESTSAAPVPDAGVGSGGPPDGGAVDAGAPPGDGGSSSDAGSVDAGTGAGTDAGIGTGGSADAGSGAIDGGSADAGGGGGGPVDAGSEPVDGGSEDAGSGSVDAGSVDAGSGSGSAECDGLTPTLPGPGIEVSAAWPPFGDCLDRSTSDGTGTVLLQRSNDFDNGEAIWTAFDRSGNDVGETFATSVLQPMPFSLESGFLWFNSFQACSPGSDDACKVGAVLRRLSSSLHEISRTTLYDYVYRGNDPPPDQTLWGASDDPRGGAVVTHLIASHDPTIDFAISVRKFDAQGTALAANIAATGPGVRPVQIISGVSEDGAILVLWHDGSTLRGRWLTSNAEVMAPAFVASLTVPKTARLSLSRLLDGTLVLQQDGAWTLRFSPGSPVPGIAPDWLATRPNTRLSIVRQATAYLLTFPSASCEPVHAALFARSGTRCGAIDFPAQSCPTAAESGYDGTVMVSGYDAQSDRCTRTFWPQLLR
jgi:hypothetical protein